MENEAEGTDEATETLEATQLDKDKPTWTLDLSGDEIRGRCQGAPGSFTVRRDGVLAQLTFVDGLLMSAALQVKHPKLALKFQPEAYRKLKNWAGQGLLLKGVLQRRIGWAFPLAVLFLLSSLPIEADPAAGAEAVPFDWISAALGGGLLVQGIAAQKWTHRSFLLVDSFWFLCLALSVGLDIANGDHIAWSIVIVMQLWFSFTGVRDWNRFRAGTY